MKKETIEGRKNLKPNTLGATSLQISEEDCTWLVGGIVEKGFSDKIQTRPLGPSAGPRPNVVPFPVARHRSHGPHWAPKVGNFNVNNDYDNDADKDDGREEDFNGMDLGADIANPLHRKDKKSLDFSRWQEIMNKDDKSLLHWKGKEMNMSGLTVENQSNEISPDKSSRQFAKPEDAKFCRSSRGICARKQSTAADDKAPSVLKDLPEETEDRLRMAIDDELPNFRYTMDDTFFQPAQWTQNGMSNSKENIMAEMVPQSNKELQMESEMQCMPTTHIASGFVNADSIYDDSLESQIDAENHALLSKMSADEIAEAQAEIMAKLKPEFINALKKRGQKKVKASLSDMGTVGEADSMQHAENLSILTADTDNSKAHKPVQEVPVDKQTEEENKVSPNMSPKDCSLWNAWSARVERVGTLRFSLDGSPVDSGITHVSDTGNASSQSGYSADTVSERDFLRTEGDPGAAGYTIKEAVALTRSVVPGQRTLALNLIASVLDRAICSICQNQVGFDSYSADANGSFDWEAVWAFALGPEPELALSLRLSLDDNHNSVVLACAKAIQCVLSCDMNEIIFDIYEKASTYSNDVLTAPVFRSKPDINVGFLRGGFWKYNTKPSNIILIGEESDDKPEGERTIQDDIVVAGQDIAAGLVRMGILPRICYLLETDPSASLEECLISILIAIARHSPTCAAAIMNCERLVQTVANRFTLKEHMEINPCRIKSVMLLKVLARIEKKNCLIFLKNGIFHQVTWHLYRYPFSLDQWVKSGREACKCLSTLMVEQLRLWKVCITYGYFFSEFSELLASICMWLSLPSIELLVANDVMNEYLAITKEVYLVLDVLAGRLPNFFSVKHEGIESNAQDKESWSWSHVGPIIDLALQWIEVKSIPYFSRFIGSQSEHGGFRRLQDSEVNSLLWVISSVLHMLSSVLKAVIPADATTLANGNLPWLPQFVPKIGLEIIKNGYMGFLGETDAFCSNHPENGSVVECLFRLRLKSRQEIAISSTCCLKGLIQVVASVDKLIQLANLEIHNAPSKYPSLSREDKILATGILKSSAVEMRGLLTTLMKLITNEWQCMQPIEVFGRGGPAPGVGVGWGASGGGYWSLKTLLAQQDAILLICLLEVSEIPPVKDPVDADEISCSVQRINCTLAACLIVGPRNSSAIDKLLNIMFQVPVLKYLDFSIRQVLCLRKGLKPFCWNYKEEEYLLFADVLATHFRNRWLSVKKKPKTMGEINHSSRKLSKKGSHFLETIHEDMYPPSTAGKESNSLILEWAYQRLHLPAHWFLSAISTIHLEKDACPPNASYNFLEVTKGGLFFLLGIEAVSTFLTSESCSPVTCVPVVWKLHALSVILLSGMSVLEDEKSRDIYETLQNFYGELLDEKRLTTLHDNLIVDSLQFKSDIHENYSTFIETLVEQFAAESYGDMVFGRQVAIYLHRSVEASVRLATWNALSNARALELLPPLDKCITMAEGYLEPIENDERILESYVKSWVSGALDKAAIRSSAAFSLVLHHLSCFIFGNLAGDTLSVRNKIVKSLLRDYSHKQKHEDMMMKLIRYKKPFTIILPISEVDSSLYICETEKRLQLLKEICEGNSSLMTTVEKLESCIKREFPA